MKRLLLLIFFLSFLSSYSKSYKFLKEDLVVVKDGKFQISFGIALKSLYALPLGNSESDKISLDSINVKFFAEASSTSDFSRDKFIFFSSVFLYSNLIFLLDSLFDGYIDNNVFLSNVDLKFLDNPFDLPDITFTLLMDKHKYSITGKIPFNGHQRSFSETWEDFFNKKEKIEKLRLFIVSRKKILRENILDLSSLKDYSNVDFEFSFKFPSHWYRDIEFTENEEDEEFPQIQKIYGFFYKIPAEDISFSRDTLYEARILILSCAKTTYEEILSSFEFFLLEQESSLKVGKSHWSRLVLEPYFYDEIQSHTYLFTLEREEHYFLVAFLFSGDFDTTSIDNYTNKIIETFVFSNKLKR